MDKGLEKDFKILCDFNPGIDRDIVQTLLIDNKNKPNRQDLVMSIILDQYKGNYPR
jgi:hypothetical protein